MPVIESKTNANLKNNFSVKYLYFKAVDETKFCLGIIKNTNLTQDTGELERLIKNYQR